MITIEDFYRISQTDESMYDQRGLDSINAGLLELDNPEQLLPFAEFVIRFNARNRKLLKAADKLLLHLAEQGSAEHQCSLGNLILYREFTLSKPEYPAKEAASWLLKSYQQDYAPAAVSLHALYSENRKGSPRNHRLSKFYAQEAVRLGSDVNFGDIA